jgi:signal transduction histidine kinase/ligand-binding sensor domain-containing protein
MTYHADNVLALHRHLPAWRRLLGTIVFSLCMLCSNVHAIDATRLLSQYGHTAWRLQDGDLPAPAYPIAQTTDGYLWIGTQAGVVRYDGARFVPLDTLTNSRLSSPFIVALHGAKDGSLWIGTTTGLSRWKDGKLTDFGDVKGMVQSFAEDENGKLWLLRYSKEAKPLCEVVGSGVTCYGAESGLIPAGRCCDSMITDGKGTFWMGSDTSLVEWRQHTQARSFPIPAKIKAGTPGQLALARSPAGEIWAGLPITGAGLGLQRFVSDQWQPFHAADLDGASLAVLKIFQDRAGSLWIGTMDHGIYRLTSGRVDHFDSKDGLSSDSVYSFFEDREGSIWVTTSAGIDRFRDFKVWSYTTREGLTVDEVDAVLAGRDGTIWAGTANSLAVLDHSGMHSLRTGKELPGTQVASLFEDHAGRLWVGIDNGLWIYTGGKFTAAIKQNEKGVTGLVLALAQDTVGDIWALYEHPSKLLRLRDDHVAEVFDGPVYHSARSMASDPGGGLWLGLENGDLVHTGAPERVISTHLGTSVRDVAVASHGLVLGATSKGLIVFKQGTLRILSAKDGLPCDAVNGLVEGDAGSLWLFMSCGLAKVELPAIDDALHHPDHTISAKVIGVIDGMRPAYAPFQRKIARAPDGALWLATGVLLQTFDPHAHTAIGATPAIHIEGLTADRKQYPFGGDLTLPALTRDVQIDYTATELAVPQLVRFRYRLDGRDQDWVDAGERRQAFYTDLPPGTYRFHVAANSDGNGWIEAPATLDFTVQPAFYQTGLFTVLVVAVVALVLWLLFAWRIAQAKIRVRTIVEERHAERERIARELHDTYLQVVQTLVLKVHAASRKLPDGQTKGIIINALDLADDALVEGRNRIAALRATSTDTVDIAAAMKAVAREYNGDKCPAFEVIVNGAPRSIDPLVIDEVYAGGREALLNAFAHSCADKVVVSIDYNKDGLRLEIADNGKGIDPQIIQDGGVHGHWGLRGIRERMERVGGKCRLLSDAKTGTTVILFVPASRAYMHGSYIR